MLKPLTLSLSLAAAFALCGVSRAGGLFHHEAGCETCGLASPQGTYVSPQSTVVASPQGEYTTGCGDVCAPKKCALFSKMNGCFTGLCAKLKPKPKCYTYEWVLKKKRVHGHSSPCASPTCETCSSVYPSGQGVYTSPQAGYSSPQAYGSGQIAVAPTSMMAPTAPAGNGDEAPPAPEVAPAAPAAPAPSTPAPPAPPAPAGPMSSSLLFSTPSGN